MSPKYEREASSSKGENIEYISLPKRNDSTEGVGPGPEYEESQGEKSNGQNNMIDLGLPSSFPHRRTGGGKETFECNLCNVILTSVAHKDGHVNGKNHLAKQNKLRQQNPGQEIQSVIGVHNPPKTKLNKVKPALQHAEAKMIKFHNVLGAHPVAPNDQGINGPCCGFGFCRGETLNLLLIFHGQEFLAVSDPTIEPYYQCSLCDSQV